VPAQLEHGVEMRADRLSRAELGTAARCTPLNRPILGGHLDLSANSGYALDWASMIKKRKETA
jgi:hypothetical protein